ncbi:MAG: hypothetical protein ABH865_00130 [Candidatus Omnitrophota bacterium]|nr:hypothetical protein [Candidatus Omnitrophota bacterium]
MRKSNYFLFMASLIIASVIILPSAFCVDETITISTYYPAPYGIYKELRSQRIAIGENYINNVQYCWAPKACANQINATADLVVEGKVGIGTVQPLTSLQVVGQQTDLTTRWSQQGGDIIRLMHHDASRGLQMRIGGWVDLESFGVPLMINYGSCLASGSWNSADCQNIIMASNNLVTGATNPGRVGIGTAVPAAKLDVVGGVRIGDDATCDATKAGTMRYHGNQIQYCDQNAWKVMGGGGLHTVTGEVGGPLNHRHMTTPPPTFNHNLAVPAGYTRGQCNLFVSMKYYGWLGQNKACGMNVAWRNHPSNANQWQVTCQHRDGDGEPSWREGLCNYQIICQ